MALATPYAILQSSQLNNTLTLNRQCSNRSNGLIMTEKKKGNIFIKMDPVHRILISLSTAAVMFFFLQRSHFNTAIKATIVWDVFALTYVFISWVVFFTSSLNHIVKKARKDDGSKLFVFLLVLVACFASMVTVLVLIVSKDSQNISPGIYLPAIISGMLLSWFLVHTTFCFHYAHMYYDNVSGTDEKKGGLEFPSEDNPDYLDFAYFSFVIGMTFQVSDVEISSRAIRRQVLLHGILAFLLNTFVVALTINLVAGLKS